VTHRFCFRYRRAWFSVVLLALVVLLVACGGQQSTPDPANTVSITRTDGTATLARAVGNSRGDLPDSTLLAPRDQLYTAPDRTVTLQFPDGSTLQLGPDSQLVLFSIRSADQVAVFRLLAGSVTGNLRSNAFEVQAYEEVALNFRMVLTDLTAVSRGVAGTYQLGFDGNILKAVVNAGEFDLRSGNQQATLPPSWQAIAEPGKPFRVVSLITPTPAPLSATEAPTATPIQIISITPANAPTETPIAADTPAVTITPTRTPTRVQRTIVASTPTPATLMPATLVPTTIVNTPVPPATSKPGKPPKPTKPPTNPPPPPPPPQPTPQPTPKPQPTEVPTLGALR
jgi:hypothetical protein